MGAVIMGGGGGKGGGGGGKGEGGGRKGTPIMRLLLRRDGALNSGPVIGHPSLA